MKKILYPLFLIIIMITVIFTGCNETESATINTQNNVFMDSDLVELIDSELIFNRIGKVIKRVEVKYRFHNLLNEKLDLNIYAEFFDEDGNSISKEGPKNKILAPEASVLSMLN